MSSTNSDMAPIRVAIVGASGETGSSIVTGLLAAGNFSIVALTRPSSLSKPANIALRRRGVQVLPLDLAGPEGDLVKALENVDVVVSAIGPHEQLAQIPLANAAKKAGVKRFVPCGFMTVVAPGGIINIRDAKEVVYNHIKHLALPFTVIDVGWWYQIAIPRLPSGRIDYFGGAIAFNTLVVDGQTPSALTDLGDIGTYVAAIINDARTLNKYVLSYSELWKPVDVYAKLEELSGEKIPRDFVSEAQLRQQLADAIHDLERDPKDGLAALKRAAAEYSISWGVRGDNTPGYAEYLGYLDAKELYPHVKFRGLEDFMKSVLAGGEKGVYQDS